MTDRAAERLPAHRSDRDRLPTGRRQRLVSGFRAKKHLMSLLVQRLLRTESTSREQPSTGSSVPPTDANAVAMGVGLHDATLGGWYKQDTGELFEGFPILPDDVVVDVGCGHGGNASFCGTRGAEIIMTDVDARALAVAEQRLKSTQARKVTALLSNSYPLPIKSGIASKVIATEVIEHVDDPAQFLAELTRIGRPGCLYFLTAPDAAHEHLQKHVAPPVYYQKPNHIRVIERGQFVELVVDAGLMIERQGHFGFYWALWFMLFWACDVDLSSPRHPVLDHWSQAWNGLLDTRLGPSVKRALDEALPKTQFIIARKR